MGNLILKFRKFYKWVYIFLRRFNLKRVVKSDKKRNTNTWVLSGEQTKSAKSFYSDYKNISLIYHNFYTEKRGEYHDEYLPDDLYYNYVDMYYNDHQTALIFDNKALYDTIFHNVKQPETICKRRNGFWFLGNETTPATLLDVWDSVFSENECFIKRAVDCGGGVGVWHFDTSVNNKDSFLKIVNNVKEDIIIQKAIKPHPDMSRINPSCINTIRTVSYLGNDGVKIYANVLRMGSGGSKVDNISSGGLTCNIDNDGRLGEWAYKSNGEKIQIHPDSNVKFEGYIIPSFEKIQKIVKEIHYQIPQFRLVSWDFTIDNCAEPVLVEANMSSGGINVVQLAHGPLFGKDTKKILDEVFKGE